MKWGYIIALVVIVALLFSISTVRNAVFGGGEPESTESVEGGSTKSGGAAGRLGEMDAASETSREAAR